MKSKNTPVTLQAIGKIIDQKLDQKLDPIIAALGGSKGKIPNIHAEITSLNTKVVGIYGELDGIKQQIIGLGNKVDSIDSKLEAHRRETKEGFDTVFDGLDNINRVLDKDHEVRIRRLETKVFVQ